MASEKKVTENVELVEAQEHDRRAKQGNTAGGKTCQAVTILFALLALAGSIFAVYITLFSQRENITTYYNATGANEQELQNEIKQVKESLKALSTKVDHLKKSLETSQHSSETEFSQVWDELFDLKSKIKNKPKNNGSVKVLKDYLILPILIVSCLNLM